MKARQLRIALLVAATIGGSVPPSSVSAGEPETIYLCECRRAATPPLIDGNLNDPAWEKAVPVTNFVTMYQKLEKVPVKRTTVRTLFDESSLYVSLELHDDHPEKIRASHTDYDSDVYWDDSVEIFIEPGNERRAFYQLGINALGTRRDCAVVVGGGGMEYHIEWGVGVDWKSAVRKHSKGWNLEVAIPFSAFGVKPVRGGMWAFQVQRFAHSDINETSVWSPGGVYNTPEKFGTLLFDKDVSGALATIARAKRHPEVPGWRMVFPDGELTFTPGKEKVNELAAALEERLETMRKNLSKLPSEGANVKELEPARAKLAQALTQCRKDYEETGPLSWRNALGVLQGIEKKLDDLKWKVRLVLFYDEQGLLGRD